MSNFGLAHNTFNEHVEIIKSVQMSILNNDDTLKYSATKGFDNVGITEEESFNDSTPKEGGIYDLRMGVTENTFTCQTCKHDESTCNGHFGHIQLARPVLNYAFKEFLETIIRNTCINCGNMHIYKNPEFVAKLRNIRDPKGRYNRVKEYSKTINTCYNCEIPAYKIDLVRSEDGTSSVIQLTQTSAGVNQEGKKTKTSYSLQPEKLLEHFKRISDDAYHLMGLNPKLCRGENMMFTNLPVPSPKIRPYSTREFTTDDNDLTIKLMETLKANNAVSTNKTTSNETRTALTEYSIMQYSVMTYFSPKVPSSFNKALFTKSSRTVQTLKERLEKKSGRFRSDLLGKRVDFSARTVISCEPDIGTDQLSIPISTAKTLTIPVTVTSENHAHLTMLCEKGQRGEYPGALNILRKIRNQDGSGVRNRGMEFLPIRLGYGNKPIHLEIGDKVERHLVNGDYVIFNRQPSLHKISMMVHQIIVDPKKDINVFGMNVSVTEPYNADFDGDEMNLHPLQSPQTIAEAKYIMGVKNRIINPSNSSIAINIKQDTLMGLPYLTNDKTDKIHWRVCMQILSRTSVAMTHTITKDKEYYTGKELFSQVIPKVAKDNTDISKYDINYSNEKITIEDGNLVRGKIGKDEIQLLTSLIWYQHTHEQTINFIDDIQRLILTYFLYEGYSLGLGNLIISAESMDKVRTLIETKRRECSELRTTFENNPDYMNYHTFESRLLDNMRSVQPDNEAIVAEDLDKDGKGLTNGFFSCIMSRSSGTSLNFTQVCSAIGPTIVQGDMIKKQHNDRTTPHFTRNDNSIFARGFIPESYVNGITPISQTWTSAAGVEGVVTSAVATSVSGYLQRKCVAQLNDTKVTYTTTVRNAGHNIIELVYGGNGISVEKLINQKIDFIKFSDDKLVSQYKVKMGDDMFKKYKSMRDEMRELERRFNIGKVKFNDVFPVPFDLKSYIKTLHRNNTKSKNSTTKSQISTTKLQNSTTKSQNSTTKSQNSTSTITDKELYEFNKNLVSSLRIFNNRNDTTDFINDHNIFVIEMYIYDTFNPNKIIHEYQFSTDDMVKVFDYATLLYERAKVNPGEMVGSLAAQSIVSPVSQATLKSFHKAGTGKAENGGIERMNEIINLTKKIKTPNTTIYLNQSVREDKTYADRIVSYLNHIKFVDIIEKIDIIWDPENMYEKEDNIGTFFGVEDMSDSSIAKSMPLLMRMELSKELKFKQNVDFKTIKMSFYETWINKNEKNASNKAYKSVLSKIDNCFIASNYDNSELPMIHIRFDSKSYDTHILNKFKDFIVNNINLNGIPNISAPIIMEQDVKSYDDKGNTESKKQFVLNVDGLNFYDILCIKNLEYNDLICNDINTVIDIFGHEAGANIWIKEFNTAVGSELKIAQQHTKIMMRSISFNGTFVPVNRTGFGKICTDIFSKVGYEMPTSNLIASATFAEKDHVRTVTSAVVLGGTHMGGTGAYDILYDHKFAKQFSKNKKNTKTNVQEVGFSSNVLDVFSD